MIKTINPATGLPIATYKHFDKDAISSAISLAETSQDQWRRRSLADRSSVIRRLADQIDQDIASLSRLATTEMGKPIAQAEAELRKCIDACHYYADHAEAFLAHESVAVEGQEAWIAYEPLGAVLCIMPWNFPFWQVIRFAVPALIVGNSILLKHASMTTGCALAIEKLLGSAGLPKGVLQTLIIGHEAVEQLLASPVVQAVTLTGSEQAGRSVAALAGSNLKKSILELGGSDPYIVLEDADLDRAISICSKARMVNSGQSCVAAKRFIVVESIYESFCKGVTKAVEALKTGDPLLPDTDVGPLAKRAFREELHRQVRQTLDSGAKLLTGGQSLDRAGFFYQPTVIADVEPGMACFDEETFGPVAVVVKATSEEHAVTLANQSRFGLGAAIFGADNGRLSKLAASDLQAGVCAINGQVVSNPRLPFGGIKDSGYGRELSKVGLREFTNVKTITVAT